MCPCRSETLSKQSSTCRTLAPEEIVRGAFVIVLTEVDEFVWVPCYEELMERRLRPLRVRWIAPCIEPLEVVDVCLPLVVARTVQGELRCLDVRRHGLAELPRKAGRRLVERMREAARKAEKAARKQR